MNLQKENRDFIYNFINNKLCFMPNCNPNTPFLPFAINRPFSVYDISNMTVDQTDLLYELMPTVFPIVTNYTLLIGFIILYYTILVMLSEAKVTDHAFHNLTKMILHFTMVFILMVIITSFWKNTEDLDIFHIRGGKRSGYTENLF